MRQSQLFTKTTKQVPEGETAVNAQLLEQGGFVYKNLAGVYSYLPLGLRVLNKITAIIREEMNELGAQELFLNSLQNPEIWKKTDRWSDEAVDVWFKTNLKNGSELGLANTHEETLTDIAKHHIHSYKDLPTYVYQFQTKFRNELRAKSGLMRVREFIMKDLYSFSRTEEELNEFYEKCADAYSKIFKRVGLGDTTYRTFASGGPFSKFSDEFQTVSEAGEDTIFLDKKKKIAVNKEVYTDDVLEEVGLKKEDLEEVKAIEVGNIFKLGTRFSEPLELMFTDKDGTKKPVIMGSYGIGPGRVMGTIVETNHDERGIIWPETIAPFAIHLIVLPGEAGAGIIKKADKVYETLKKAGIEVFYDDREGVSPGEKFADADLIGIPYRAVISKKTGDKIELKKRNAKDLELVTERDLVKRV